MIHTSTAQMNIPLLKLGENTRWTVDYLTVCSLEDQSIVTFTIKGKVLSIKWKGSPELETLYAFSIKVLLSIPSCVTHINLNLIFEKKICNCSLVRVVTNRNFWIIIIEFNWEHGAGMELVIIIVMA
jgi:hypothetical protein